MLTGSKNSPRQSLRCFTGSLQISTFDFSKRSRPTPKASESHADPAALAAATGLALYPYQQALLDSWQASRRIVLKARQVGFSTVVALEALAVALAQPGATVLLVSRNQDLAANLLRSCYQTLARLSSAPKLTTENDFTMELATGSRILSQPATRSAGRGFSANLVVLDEFAYAAYAEEIYQSVSPAMAASGGRMIIGSTPNGDGNLYAELWATAGAEWQRTTIPWHVCPAYWTAAERAEGVLAEQGAWYRKERPNYTARQWAAEFDCSFAGSGDAVFRPEAITGAGEGATGEQPRRSGCRYLATVDVGRRADATVINVIDVTELPYQRVYHERLEQIPYPVIQQRIAVAQRAYGATLWVESNGVGDPVIENLDVPARPFVTTAKSKVQAIQALALLLERGNLKAQWTAQERRELSVYRYDDADLTQDCVMSLAIAAYAIERPDPVAAAADAYRRRREAAHQE